MELLTILLAVIAGLAVGNAPQASALPDVAVADNHGSGNGNGGFSDLRKVIKKLVVLVVENQSYDHVFGGQKYNPTLRGINPHNPPCYDANATDPHNHQKVCATPDATNNIPEDPDHSYLGTIYSMYESFTPDDRLIQEGKLKPNMRGCVTRQGMVHNLPVNESSLVARYFKPEAIPVLTALAEEFALLDTYFSVPCPTRPNRLYLTGGTSQGFCTNDDKILGGAINSTSIFQAVTEKGLTYKDYSDSSIPDSADYNWTHSTGHMDHIHPLAQYLVDLNSEHLPDLAYIKAGSNMDMHPPANMSNGEGLIKLLYESLRASKYWDETLMIITWDEAGGHCDHYPPPQTRIPRPDDFTFTTKAPDGTNTTFKFDLLGPRVGCMLISPYVGRGVVEHDGRNNGGVYNHASWLNFASQLWDLKGLDNPRIKWSATWEHLINLKARQDTPQRLPAAIHP